MSTSRQTMRVGAALLFALPLLSCQRGASTPPVQEVVSTPPHQESVPEIAAAEPEPVVWIAGDVLISAVMRRTVRSDPQPALGFAEIIKPITSHIRDLDPNALLLVNLETPVASKRRHPRRRPSREETRRLKPARLNAPDFVLGGLALAGVDAVGLANNHALDQERGGLAETIEKAQGHGLLVTGAGSEPHRIAPIRIGPGAHSMTLFSVFDKDYPEAGLEEGEVGVASLDDALLERIADHASSERVVVIVHMVGELYRGPTTRCRAWVEQLVGAGVSAVIVHGSHVVAPVEWVRAEGRVAPVAWGIGNLLSGMGMRAHPSQRRRRDDRDKWSAPETRHGMLARVISRPSGVELSFVPTWVASSRGHTGGAPIRHRVLPLPSCGPVESELAFLPTDVRSSYRAWMTRERASLLRRASLPAASSCASQTAHQPIPMPPLQR